VLLPQLQKAFNPDKGGAVIRPPEQRFFCETP
jgi:hypothetical protein